MNAIEAIEVLKRNYPSRCYEDLCKAVDVAIKSLSAHPKRNMGKWVEKDVIYVTDTKYAIDAWQSCKCSVCKRYDTRPYMYYFSEPRFCSYCGVEMERIEE